MSAYTVVVCQHRLLHYRVDFFELLRSLAAERGIEVRLLHGQASPTEKLKNDEGSIPWAVRVHNRWVRFAGVDLLWQPFLRHALQADLVVIMQENRILSNYPLLLLRRLLGRPTLAFWGHGANFQSRNPNSLRERWKRALLTQVDFWFAYTQATVAILAQVGFPAQRIVNLNNATDTRRFRDQCASVANERASEVRRALGIADQAPVGLFCGSLYAEKKLGLLVASGEIIRERLPDYHVIVIGSGPALPELEQAAQTRSWLHLVGVRRGQDKAEYFRAAQVMLNPGATGLHILDSFAAGLPFATTRNALHGPEIVYLEDGHTGILTEDTAQAYAEGVLKIIQDPERRQKMAAAAREAAGRYSVEAMAHNFLSGLESCRRLGPKERP